MGAAIDALAQQGGQAAHAALSQALEVFAGGAATTVANHGGSLIYSGGDDVLALLPLHGSLSCARTLHDDFSKALSKSVASLPVGVTRPTLSVGLAIVHHLEPFGEAREWAKKAEQTAKAYRSDGGIQPKNALAILVVPRSGAETTVVDSWKNGPDTVLKDWIKLLGSGAISSKAPHDLLEALEPLKVGLGVAERKGLCDVVVSLSRRVLSAKRERGGGASLGEDVKQMLEHRFRAAADPFDEVERLANELLVAQALLEGYRAAFGKPPNQERVEDPAAAKEVRT
jgi:CRISPR-associated protein Cmr2